MFGETFGQVKAFESEGERIKSLQDPGKKMSKSGDDGIALSDGPDLVLKKIKKAVTDSEKVVKYDPAEKPAKSNLLTIYHLLSGKSLDSLQAEYQGKTYDEFKKDLAEVVIDFLKPLQKRYAEFSADPGRVENILIRSEENARTIAAATMAEVKAKLGLN